LVMVGDKIIFQSISDVLFCHGKIVIVAASRPAGVEPAG
jgi:hypothetical protein